MEIAGLVANWVSVGVLVVGFGLTLRRDRQARQNSEKVFEKMDQSIEVQKRFALGWEQGMKMLKVGAEAVRSLAASNTLDADEESPVSEDPSPERRAP